MKVFIVEDDRQVGRILELMVRDTGAKVSGSATDADSFFEALDSTDANIVLLDWFLDKGDARPILERLRKERDLPVLVITGSINTRLCVDALRSGALGFITKLDAMSNLRTALEQTRRRKSYVTDELLHGLAAVWEELDQEREHRQQERKQEEKAVPVLTPREQEIMELLVNGHSFREIAEKLCISVQTVHTHKKNMIEKFEAGNLAELVKKHLEQQQ